jgi:small subunit ribosomal protein S6
LRFYETTIVLSPLSDEAAVEREIEKVTQAVSRASGRMVVTQKWGTKRMAYPIQKHAQGNYIHFVYQAPPGVPGELDAGFRINESVLRHLTVLVEGPLPTPGSTGPGRAEEAVVAPVAAPETPEEEKF